MIVLKKLLFVPFFLIVFFSLIYKISPLLKLYDFLFSLSINTFIELIIISALISLLSFIFVLFASLAQDWKIVLPAAIIASTIAIALGDPALSLILAVTILVSLLVTFLSLENSLKSYLNFQPSVLLGPAIRHLSGLLILSFCLVYFLATNKIVAQNGFQIPDSLIDTALKLTAQSQPQQETTTPQLSIPPDQIDLLRKNPQLLKQYGLDPSVLDSLDKPSQSSSDGTNSLIKQTIKDQLQSFLKPYLGFIPAVLALLLLLTLQSLTSIINLLIYPLLWLIFYILEKTKFITFTEEQRVVRKMVI